MEQNQKIIIKSPVAIEWRIPENNLKEIKDMPGETLYTESFDACNIPGVKYFIGICPNENVEDRLGKTCIYLCLADEDEQKIEANFDIKIESANYSSNKNYVYEESDGWGAICCTTEELFDPEKQFIVDGNITIKIEGTLMVKKEMPKKTKTFVNHSDALCLQLWQQEESKNFTIIADGKQVTAHKVVLAARSPVFARMFESRMKEAEENRVVIKDFPFNIVETASKLCYHHSLVTDITLDDKMKLLSFFDKYDIESLKEDLEAELISEIDESNVCLLTNCSLLSNALKLKTKCTECLRDCLESKNPVCDIDILDKDYALNLFKNAFCHVVKTDLE